MDGAQQTDGNTRSTGMSAPENRKNTQKRAQIAQMANNAKQIQAGLKENLHRENYRLPTKLACELFRAFLTQFDRPLF